jgi:hypothetical protein
LRNGNLGGPNVAPDGDHIDRSAAGRGDSPPLFAARARARYRLPPPAGSVSGKIAVF